MADANHKTNSTDSDKDAVFDESTSPWPWLQSYWKGGVGTEQNFDQVSTKISQKTQIFKKTAGMPMLSLGM